MTKPKRIPHPNAIARRQFMASNSYVDGDDVLPPPTRLISKRSKDELALLIKRCEGSLIALEESMAFSEGLIGSFITGLSGLPARVTKDAALRQKIDIACDEVRTALADEFEKKAAELRSGNR